MRHSYPPVQTHMRLPVHSPHSRLFSLFYSLHLSVFFSSEEASSTKHQGLESEHKSLTELQKECTAKRWVIVNLQLSVPLFSLFHPSFSTLESSGLTSVRHYRDGPQNGALLHSAFFFSSALGDYTVNSSRLRACWIYLCFPTHSNCIVWQ